MSNPTKPSVDIVENDNSNSIDVIDSTSKINSYDICLKKQINLVTS